MKLSATVKEAVADAVLNSLTSASGQRTYDHAIREFVAWYCSEPRGRFPQLVDSRSGVNRDRFATISPSFADLYLRCVLGLTTSLPRPLRLSTNASAHPAVLPRALPATASLKALVRLAHQRWAIEQKYQ